MKEMKVTVGGNLEVAAARRFADAWRRAEAGETFEERHLAFESWEGLARVLTPRRAELLRFVRRRPAGSIRQLAQGLGRDYSNVHADVKALAAEGLLDTTDGRVSADYDVIDTCLVL